MVDVLTPEAVAACMRTTDAVEPVAGWAPAYEDAYARYRLLYPAIKEGRAP